MFTPKVTRPRMVAANPTNVLAHPPSTLMAQRDGPVEQTPMVQPAIGWDFSKVRVFAPDGEGRPEGPPTEAHAASAGEAPEIVTEVLRSSGRPLEPELRHFFEPRFGHDFSAVRVHADHKAAESARSVGALAYAVGSHVVFADGRCAPDSGLGLRLLAHELAHVVQHDRAMGIGQPTLTPNANAPFIAPESAPAEGEADDLARRVLAGKAVAGSAHASRDAVLHRVVRLDPIDPAASRFLDALSRLTGSQVTSTGTLTQGASLPGASPSVTTVGYVQRAISAARSYILRSGATAPSGAAVSGVQWERASGGATQMSSDVTITVNTADIGDVTWTVDELLSQGFTAAVTANDRSTQSFPASAPGSSPGGSANLDDLTATRLPFANQAFYSLALNLIRQRVPAVGANPNLDVDVELALRAARGVTLGEILRGLETNTPFRIVEERDGDRIRATYFDPRAAPGPNQAQTLPRRSVTFLTGPGRTAATPAALRPQDLPGLPAADVQRASVSCTQPMLAEISALVATGRNLIANAVGLLNSQQNLDALLRQHFGPAGPAQRGRIAANYRIILSEMDLSRHAWICAQRGTGQGCNQPGVTGRTGVGQQPIQLCVEPAPPFVPRPTTVLHEVVHASGIGTLPAGTETYLWQGGVYPGSDPLHNADSYAQFAIAAAAIQPSPPSPPLTAPPSSRSPDAGAPQSPGPPMHLQRASHGGTEAIHEGVAEDYRRRHGLPAGGVDEFGRTAGPSNAEIVYGGLAFPVPLPQLADMSAWELARVDADRLVSTGAAAPATGPNFSDYARARQLAIDTFSQLGVQTDPDRPLGPVGRQPNANDEGIIEAQVQRVLQFDGPAGLTSPRRRMQGGTSMQPIAAGHVRIADSDAQFRLKQYEHDRWIAERTGFNDTYVLAQLKSAWPQANFGASTTLTRQERLLALWLQQPAAGFFNPVDDTIYLSPRLNLQEPADLEIIRHESAHFLGGGRTGLEAFKARLQPTSGSAWLDYFVAFEEGIAEILAQDSAPPVASASPSTSATTTTGTSTTTVTVTTTGAYLRQVAWIRDIMAADPQNRSQLLRAYFSGQIPESVFALLLNRTRFGPPPAR